MMSAARSLPTEGELPSLDGATGWLNTQPLTASDLRGKVVLVEFLTFTCINWLRTLPYVRAWAEKYKDFGLVVLGVHTPEFAIEKNIDNIREAMASLQVDFPIAIDSDYAVWSAFQNIYWPALYFVDAQGKIRHHSFGEGEYDMSEQVIQQLLTEAGISGFDPKLVSVEGTGIEAAADWGDLRSPENYVGYDRTENFSSPGGIEKDEGHDYSAPDRLDLNHWALTGNWTIWTQPTLICCGGWRSPSSACTRWEYSVLGHSSAIPNSD
jgi:thiol-disulfide isomerase/thioredoxin